jgi:phosphoglycolate phosphatase-like HAD superfamily hydrolase
MVRVIVDIDDTLINTRRRLQALWALLLEREVPEGVVDMRNEEIFMKFAAPEQKGRVREFQRRFYDLLLCLDKAGVNSFALHEPIPYAAEVLQRWSRQSEVAYLTGRTENTRALTLEELQRFGFPIANTELVMFRAEDYARAKGEDPRGPTLVETRFRLAAELCHKGSVVRVVDDYPGYFPVFQRLKVPERIGVLRPQKYTPQQYLERGATRVIASWKELLDSPPHAS